jgi:hypothetical protein
MAAVTKESLFALLAHENTRQALGRLAQGEDVRRVAADVAGQALAMKLGKMMGVKPAEAAAADASSPAAKRPDVHDAEFVEINVTDQAKKAGRQ